MSLTIYPNYFKIKDSSGEYHAMPLVAENVESALQTIQAAKNSIPDDYSKLTETVNTLKQNLTDYNDVEYVSTYGNKKDNLYGCKFVWNGNTCTITGTATSDYSYCRLFTYVNPASSSTVDVKANNDVFKSGETYKAKLSTNNNNINIRVYQYDPPEEGQSPTFSTLVSPTGNSEITFTIPEGKMITMRLEVPRGFVATEQEPAQATLELYRADIASNEELTSKVENIEQELSPERIGERVINYTTNSTHNGITYTYIGDNTYNISGTASAFSIHRIASRTDNNELEKGVLYYGYALYTVNNNQTNFPEGLSVQFIQGQLDENQDIISNSIITKSFTDDIAFYADTAYDTNSLRFAVSQGTTLNCQVKVIIYKNFPMTFNKTGFTKTEAVPADTTSLNTILKNGYYILNQAYNNFPDNTLNGGYLKVENYNTDDSGMSIPNNIIQTFISKDCTDYWMRYTNSDLSGNFSNWVNLTSTTINQTIEQYNNTYGPITCTPTITSTEEHFLAATGNENDRTADIMSLLNSTSVCNLGPGNFYISTGIDLPEFSTINGCGNSTNLILKTGSSSNYIIKMGSYSTVSNIFLRGQKTTYSGYSTASTIGDKVGILYQNTPSSGSSTAWRRAKIQNCSFRDFAGSALKFENTGHSFDSNILVDNCFFYRCDAGINISSNSDFHHFTNVSCNYCYYGCINNGGNNNFVNCSFSANKINLLMDNSNNNSTNIGRNTYIGCTFPHTSTDQGTTVAIRLLSVPNGITFSNSQVEYGTIEINSCAGVRFDTMNLGQRTPIKVVNSTAVFFDNCLFYSNDSSSFSECSNNVLFKLNNCYYISGGGGQITSSKET